MFFKNAFPTVLILGVIGAEAHSFISTTGRCGVSFRGLTCSGSRFGDCCSSKSWCGSTVDHCGSGCQTGYGVCRSSIPPAQGPVSTDGRCGAKYGNQICKGSKFGDCCSQYDYCGGSIDYCDAKTCQKDFGTCLSSALPSTLSSVVTSSRPGTCLPITITLPVTTVPGERVTVTVTALSTVTLPGDIITLTQPHTIIETITQIPSPSTVTIQPDTVTVTMSKADCAETSSTTSSASSSSESTISSSATSESSTSSSSSSSESIATSATTSDSSSSSASTVSSSATSESITSSSTSTSESVAASATTSDSSSSTSTVPSGPTIPTPFCLKVLNRDVPASGFVVQSARPNSNYVLKDSQDAQSVPAFFELDEQNRLVLVTQDGPYVSALMVADMSSVYVIRPVKPSTIEGSPVNYAEVCTVRTDIAGYEGRQVLKCTATVGRLEFPAFRIGYPAPVLSATSDVTSPSLNIYLAELGVFPSSECYSVP